MQLVRDRLESAGNALHFGTVQIVTLKSGIVGYHQTLGFRDLLRAEQQGFVPYVHMERWKEPKVFQIKFSRTADKFADYLKQAGFKQSS